ncbi:hypothetical protein SLEP1_g59208 [Rubroshorea leprosula]|uniref:Uncharacterized protein n=1 Tax=Rubroshorea leprosula TaxID=152421 RepID=A0AAV5MRQ7_9ROSI|nr:hypothetical protein SLEP1_g59208 [Rubroshorea leprosula]
MNEGRVSASYPMVEMELLEPKKGAVFLSDRFINAGTSAVRVLPARAASLIELWLSGMELLEHKKVWRSLLSGQATDFLSPCNSALSPRPLAALLSCLVIPRQELRGDFSNEASKVKGFPAICRRLGFQVEVFVPEERTGAKRKRMT